MPDATDMRPSGSGLHPSHFAAVRTEILRTGAQLSHEQLRELTDALHSLIRLRRPGRPIRRLEAWIDYEPRTFV